MSNTPEWYDETKLVRIKYEAQETGWAIDMGNSTYRLANHPIRWGLCQDETSAKWGDLVRLIPNNGDKQWLEVIERYIPTTSETENSEEI